MLNDVDGRDVRRWREERGIGQTELANLLGVTNVTVYRWEAGLRKGVPGNVLERALRDLDRELAAARGGDDATA